MSQAAAVPLLSPVIIITSAEGFANLACPASQGLDARPET